MARCKDCGRKLEIGDWPFCDGAGHVSVLPERAQRFDPVVIHRDAQGNIRFPLHESAPVPEGYQRVELRTLNEVRRLEREVNLRESEKHEHRKLREDATIGETRRQLRSELRQRMQSMSPLGRDFARAAMADNDAKPREKFEANFHVVVFSQDASSREPYCDKATDWKSRRG